MVRDYGYGVFGSAIGLYNMDLDLLHGFRRYGFTFGHMTSRLLIHVVEGHDINHILSGCVGGQWHTDTIIEQLQRIISKIQFCS